MKTKLILLFTAVATLGSLTSCDAPYGPGYGYARPYNSGFGSYGLYGNNYVRPGYAYSGYRAPVVYNRPGYSGYRPGYSGYRPGYRPSTVGYRPGFPGNRPGFPGNRGWHNGHRHHNHR